MYIKNIFFFTLKYLFINQIKCENSSVLFASGSFSPSETSFISSILPPPNQWAKSNVLIKKKLLKELEASKSYFDPGCQFDTKIVPIYYYQGSDVNIECKMCHVALVINGLPKRWARVRNIDEFFEKSKSLGTPKGPKIEYLQNHEFQMDEKYLDQSKVPQFFSPNGEKLSPAFFIQKNGSLIIKNIHPTTSGVFFCFDQYSIANLNYFYILIPIFPLVYLSPLIEPINIVNATGGCSSISRLYPAYFINENDGFIDFSDRATCFQRYGTNNPECYNKNLTTSINGCDSPSTSCRLPLKFPNMPSFISISVYLKWSDWNNCENKKQNRIGMCFIQLDKPLSSSILLPKQWEWVENLNRLSKNIEFRDGIPLYSSILANWLYSVNSIDSCFDQSINGNIEGYDTFFKNLLKSVWNMTTYEPINHGFKFCFQETKISNFEAMRGFSVKDTREC